MTINVWEKSSSSQTSDDDNDNDNDAIIQVQATAEQFDVFSPPQLFTRKAGWAIFMGILFLIVLIGQVHYDNIKDFSHSTLQALHLALQSGFL